MLTKKRRCVSLDQITDWNDLCLRFRGLYSQKRLDLWRRLPVVDAVVPFHGSGGAKESGNSVC